ncbi:hypothetical protein [Clostridioides difficile]|uniref:hypothetical protein n=1 Tax=Clostridioides difficile TaxID=1496 RepID=UPI000D1F400C|nr:hypothetical protein [Clostridioides difficile]HBE9444653.1 hypothetical protein [Clostridioides difficile]
MLNSKGKFIALGLSATLATGALLTWDGSGIIEEAKTKLTEMKNGVNLLKDGEKDLIAKAKEIKSQISTLETEIAKLESKGRTSSIEYRKATSELSKAKEELNKANSDANRIQEALSKYTPVNAHMTGYAAAINDDYVLPSFGSETYASKLKGVDDVNAVKGSCLLKDNNMLLALNKFNNSTKTGKTIFQKVNLNGTEVWHKELSNTSVSNINVCRATKDGGALILATSQDRSLTSSSGKLTTATTHVIKLNSQGEIEFTTQFDSGDTIPETIENIIELKDGNYLCVGSMSSANYSRVICIDKDGNQQWESKIKCEGGTVNIGNAIEMSDGDIIVVGYASKTYDNITSSAAFPFATKYTKDGTKLWTSKISDDYTYYNGNSSRPTSIVEEKDGKCVIYAIKTISTITSDGTVESTISTDNLIGNKYDFVLNNGDILVSNYFSSIVLVSSDGTLKKTIKPQNDLKITNMSLLAGNKVAFTGMTGTNDDSYVGYMGIFDLDDDNFPALTD